MAALTLLQRKRRIGIVCHTIARNVAYYRAVHPKKGLGNNFWRTASANFLDIAVLDWCKIFADDNGKHSWRKVIPKGDRDSFFQEMLVDLKVSKKEFQEYVQATKKYRNQFIAHLDDKNTMTVPKLELLIDSTKFLLNYLEPKLDPSINKYYAYAERSARQEAGK